MDGAITSRSPEADGRAGNRHSYGDGVEVRRYVTDPYHRLRRQLAVRMLLDGVAVPAGRRPVLELGCGSASMLAEVPDPPWPVMVADLAIDALGQSVRPGTGGVCLDATRPLPVRDGSLAGILMGELIEHVYDPVALLRECRRVLVPSGLLVLTTPNLAALQDRVGFLAGRAPRQVNPLHPYLWLHIRPFTVSLLRDALRRAELEPVRVRSNYVGWRLRGGRWVKSRTLARLLPGLGGSLVVAARPR